MRHLMQQRVPAHFIPAENVILAPRVVLSALRLLEFPVLEVFVGLLGVGFEKEGADEHFAVGVAVLGFGVGDA